MVKTTTIEQFLTELHTLGVKLWLDGDRLRSRSPEGVLTAPLRQGLRERKEEIVTFLSQVKRTNVTLPPIQPVSQKRTLPLSFSQQRLWFVEQLEGPNAIYHPRRAIRLRGRLDIKALAQSLTELVARHESLRTTFALVEDQPTQLIQPPFPVSLPVVDLARLAKEEQEEAIRQFAYDWVKEPFDLEKGPLLRVTLFSLGDEEHLLLYWIHHIITDGWSNRILIKELCTLYEVSVHGSASSLPPLALQYKDFAYWQRNALQEVISQQLTYWKEHLGGELPVLALPSDAVPVGHQTFSGGSEICKLSQSLSLALRTLSAKEGVSLFMTLLAAFKTLLYRYTEQEDLMIGTPITGRHRAEVKTLIGFFVNTLVLRTDLSGNPSFRDLLQRVRQITLDAYANQDVPFEKLVEELQPDRDLSRTPLFQVWFNMLNLEDERIELTELTVEKEPLFERTAMFDVSLYIFDNQATKSITLKWVYNADRFAAPRIQRMARHFACLLESIVADPSQPIASVALLTEAERAQLLVEWGRTPTLRPEHLCIHQHFERQVRRTPDAIALLCQGESLTYSELNTRANQLAHYLQERGVGPEVFVGIGMNRSLEMAVGILGILKAGGAYLPLDPTYPSDRLAFMLEDAQVKVLLTTADLQSTLPLTTQTEVVCLDEAWPTIAQLPSANPTSQPMGENLAYVIYTSGSTGKPKGVMVTHTNFSHSLQTVIKAFAITPDDVCLHTASMAFGSSARQLFAPLCQGATVVLATSAQLQDPWALFSLVKQQTVTVMELVPSHWRICTQVLAELADEQRTTLLDNQLRQLIAVGEPLSSDVPITWRETFKHQAQFINGYGQTEARPVLFYPIPTGDAERGKIVPLGRPVGNTELYLLDANLQPVPVGITGELHIGGPVIARGYLNQPELTAQKFIAHPFSTLADARLYKTGDLARYCADGRIEFVGRKDNQVKVRGVRIELGEIETCLRQHPAVQEAVALIHGQEATDKRLVAYLVTTQPTPEEKELRDFLREKMPAVMTPSRFVFLPAMPLTPNGKINRRVLPDPSEFEKQSTDPATRPKASADCFYVPSWKRSAPLQTNRNDHSPVGNWLLFVDQWGLGSQIAQRLKELGAPSVMIVSVGQQFRRLGAGLIEINPTKPDDYDVLRQELTSLGHGPLHILHLWSVTCDEQPELIQAHGFDSLLYLAQALAGLTMPIQLAVVSNQMQEVTGEEELCPEIATLLGPCKVIPLEHPNITCRTIDISLPPVTHQGGRQKLVESLITEVIANLPEKTVAYRGGYRWVEYLEPVKLDSPRQQPIRLREEGVYLITGGLGGIGLEVAAYLVQSVRAKLVLVGRSVPTDQEAHNLEKVRQLRQMGAEILLLQADVTDHAQMQHVIAKTFERFGALHGVIHAAGVRGVFETIEQKTPQSAAAVLAAKVQGTRVLEAVLQGRRLDFLLLCSSLASIVGRFGQVDYCAANAFLDAFAADHTRRGTLTIAVNWDIWQELKLPVKSNESFAIRQLLELDMQQGLLTQEGLEAFRRILAGNWHQVIVSKRDLLNRGTLIDEQEQSRSQLTSANGEARTATEALLTAIWTAVLKLPKERAISIHDNFFELGGHSLLAVQAISRIRQTFQVILPLRRLFEFPTIAELAQVLQQVGQSQAAPIVPVPRHNVIPLSFGQQRLWDWQQLAGEQANYKISLFRVLKGILHHAALEQSLATLVARHESLRTTFPVVEGEPIQFIHPPSNVTLPLIDLQGWSPAAQEREVRRLARENAYQPFNLAEGPLFRFALLRLDSQTHILLLTFHHLIIDGWSRRKLFQELATLYAAFSQGNPSPLPPQSLHYADFAHWQRHRATDAPAEQLTYWRQQLAGELPRLDFPEDYPRPAQPTFKGASQSLVLNEAVRDALQALSRQAGCTLFMTMLAAFKVLLYHKTGQVDLIVGSPNAGRTRVELEEVVGYFINPLALRTSLAGNPTFRELLHRVRQTVLGAYAHQELPFERIIAELHPQRDVNRHPIFAVWFNMINLEQQPLTLDGLTVERIKLPDQPTAMFDLTLSIREEERQSQANGKNTGRLMLTLLYRSDIFSAARMECLLAEYQSMLIQIAKQPECRLATF